MKFIADLHIHSHYSIATSKNLKPEFLDYWAALKGIQVVGTGDFTHPGWLKELKEKLEPAEPGLFTLKNAFKLPRPFRNPKIIKSKPRFLLSSEISNIYKKNDKVRKVHNLILAPDFQTVESIQHHLNAIGNITSDGRPILGLDSRDLLEICLEASENIFFIPAHIWTPWFSALGSKSGFNSIDECYEDLTAHIRAVETGLSSDPPMNWMCSFLDKFTLISNSDAHSPEKLGREANLFNTELSYKNIIDSITSKDPDQFLGTIEFFPQEGKYHYDGHRKCNLCWDPVETLKHQKKCTACGKKVTVGVMHRVAELSDRDDFTEAKNRRPFYSLVPLKEILSEILGVGPQSKSVSNHYSSLLEKAGSEFDILLHLSLDQLSHRGGELIAEGVKRMRAGNVIIKPGYDGEYGHIKVFHENEINTLNKQATFFSTDSAEKKHIPKEKKIFEFNIKEYHRLLNTPAETISVREPKPELTTDTLGLLNEEQRKAVEHTNGPALIIAGPGTGKTRIITSRITFLLKKQKVNPESILAITFTNKAAEEMKDRIKKTIESQTAVAKLTVSTFHAFGYSILKNQYRKCGRNSNFIIIDEPEKKKLLSEYLGCKKNEINNITDAISQTKQQLKTEGICKEWDVFNRYEAFLQRENLFDLDDLIQKVVYLFHYHKNVREQYKNQYKWILVDEYQDINNAQYQMVSLLIDNKDQNIYAVGDPNQAIYGFRGSDTRFINQFFTDFPETKVYQLKTSYRCSDKILSASHNILSVFESKGKTSNSNMSRFSVSDLLQGLNEGINIHISSHSTEKSEAEFVARTIEQMMGGLRFFSMDSNITQGTEPDDINSLSDFCVLCRTMRQTEAIKKAFSDHSIPAQVAGEEPFFKQSPVREIIDLLKLGLHPQNSLLTKRLAKENLIVPEQIDWLKNIINDHNLKKTIQELIDFVKGKIDFKDSFTKQRLIELADNFKNTNRFLKFTYLGSGIDTYNPDAEAVSVLTMHASKGLEFQTVFITGCEDGLIPYSYFKNQTTDVEEEKRLLYVSMTRAKKYLYLTHAQKRFLFGQTKQMNPSPFLASIQEKLIERSKDTYRRKPKKDDKQMGLF